MIRHPPRSTRTTPLFPTTTRSRSPDGERPRNFCRGSDRRPALARRISGLRPLLTTGPKGGCNPEMFRVRDDLGPVRKANAIAGRSEEHTSELQSLMRISYAVFCLKKKKYQKIDKPNNKRKKK